MLEIYLHIYMHIGFLKLSDRVNYSFFTTDYINLLIYYNRSLKYLDDISA